ncbi:MAG: DUF2834 domain-containing protein [Okeania sp. SIO2F4]|uniref:DUF2834 domain-containing protein n=1 Tax=Okeania sp. SIO2F4 TaxID=2607790 RepID=UPI00142CEDBA|nr:DUF2834 domain-containing protein [Okeania sp. SIO2F4]MDJ0519285.1 DUF2834 domain-containing protein [Trichodesmium sp. MO_231.B1]NES03415.1 DUF2834 domain-containing protein [Okeania sp. SIO2F4]
MKYFYGLLCLCGFFLPYSQFIPWILEHGINIYLLFSEAISSRISTFAWLDVLISAIVLFGFIFYEGNQKKIKYLFFPILGTLTVGVSFGLPLFLFLREIQKESLQTGSEN